MYLVRERFAMKYCKIYKIRSNFRNHRKAQLKHWLKVLYRRYVRFFLVKFSLIHHSNPAVSLHLCLGKVTKNTLFMLG